MLPLKNLGFLTVGTNFEFLGGEFPPLFPPLNTPDYMIEKRGVGHGSMITGKSTHDQQIERLWCDVYTGVLGFFYQMFHFMEDNTILDPLNTHHISALHHVFLPLINQKLKIGQQKDLLTMINKR